MKRKQNEETLSSQMKMMYRSIVTGLSHHNYSWSGADIQVGDELQLEAKTDNNFDSEAIAVSFKGEQIGWLSNESMQRSGKGVIHRMLRNELDVRCKVISHDKNNAALDKRLYVGVYLRVV